MRSSAARLAGEVVPERLKSAFAEIRSITSASTSLHGKSYRADADSYEVRLRVAARAATREKAALVGEEVEALWTNVRRGAARVNTCTNKSASSPA